MPALEDLPWSTDVARADWLHERLGDHRANVVTAIVPSGFEAYARLLHPVDDPARHGRRMVRWRDVAAWSGRPLEPDAPFHAVAFPVEATGGAPPWSGQGPREGSLAASDARALFAALRRHTRTPEDCWFCLWDGYDWTGVPLTRGGAAPVGDTSDDPIPATVRRGPEVELPDRSYYLYCGPVECALVESGSRSQTANLWWPEDRAWCVASEIDLPWTYVGGSVALVRSLVGDPGLEAVEVAPDGAVVGCDRWITELVQPAVDRLLGEGAATVETPIGTVEAELRLPRHRGGGRGRGRGAFRFKATSALGTAAGGSAAIAAGRRGDSRLRDEVEQHLREAVIRLVRG